MTAPLADFVVSVKDGKILSRGSLDAALQKDQTLLDEAQEKTAEHQEDDKEPETTGNHEPGDMLPSNKGKLILDEELQLGRVTSSAGA